MKGGDEQSESDRHAVDIALVTGAQMPVPDTESELLAQALAGLGLRAETVVWREDFAWDQVPLVVCRTPWDYVPRAPEFLAWVDRVAAVTQLVNDPGLLHWNAHKSYLLELERAGVPVVPTAIVPHGAGPVQQLASLRDLSDVVIDPAVSAGGWDAVHARADDPAAAERISQRCSRAGDVLVQPFIASVPERGEVSLISFGARFSHAVRKVPGDGEFRVQPHYGGTVSPHRPSPEELAVADAVLAAIPRDSRSAPVRPGRSRGRC